MIEIVRAPCQCIILVNSKTSTSQFFEKFQELLWDYGGTVVGFRTTRESPVGNPCVTHAAQEPIEGPSSVRCRGSMTPLGAFRRFFLRD